MTRQMAKHKILVWLLVVVFAATSVLSTGSVFASTEVPAPGGVIEEISFQGQLSSEARDDFGGSSDSVNINGNDEEIAAQMREDMMERSSDPDFQCELSITFVTNQELSDEEMEEYLWYLIELATVETDDPEQGDYLYYHFNEIVYGGRINTVEGSNEYEYQMNLGIPFYTTSTQEAAVDEAVNELLAEIITEDMSDYEKTVAIYDWVCANVEYDWEGLNNENDVLKFSAYGALIEKSAVCQGYANLVYRLMREADLDCRIITGSADTGDGNQEPHAWNIVKVGDYYYNLDATWDAGASEYNWFLNGSRLFTEHYSDEYFTYEEFTALYQIDELNYDVRFPGNGDEESGNDAAKIYTLYVTFAADGHEETEMYYLSGEEFDLNLKLPYYCDGDSEISIEGTDWFGDVLVTENGVLENGKATMEFKSVSPDGEASIEYTVDFSTRKSPDRLNQVEIIYWNTNFEDYDSNIEFFRGEKILTYEVSEYVDREKPVFIKGYFPDGTRFYQEVIIGTAQTLEIPIVKDFEPTDYHIIFTDEEPSDYKDLDAGLRVMYGGSYENMYYHGYSLMDADGSDLYMEVPYGTFSNPDAEISLSLYSDYCLINGEESLDFIFTDEDIVDGAIKETVLLTSEDKTARKCNLIIEENDGSDAYLSDLYVSFTDEEGYPVYIEIDPEDALVTNNTEEIYTIELPEFYYQDIETGYGIYIGGEESIGSEVAGLGQQIFLNNGETVNTITVTPGNPAYKDNEKTYKLKFVQGKGSSTELTWMGLQWHTYDDSDKYSRGLIDVDLEAAKTEEGATVVVPDMFYKLIEYGFDGNMLLHFEAEQHSFYRTSSGDIPFKDYVEYLDFDYEDESATYVIEILSAADKSVSQKYTINVVRSTEQTSCNNHDYTDYEVTQEPGCGEVGMKIRFCKTCGEAEWMPIPVTGAHNYNIQMSDADGHWNECVCGKEDEVYSHSYEWKTDIDGDRYKECRECKYREEGNNEPSENLEFEDISFDQDEYYYTGEPIIPKVTVYGVGNQIIIEEGVDYTIRFSNNVNVGTAQVTVTGMGAYAGYERSEAFYICPAVLDPDEVTVELENKTYVYDGEHKTPKVTVKYKGKVIDSSEYFVNYDNNKEIGTAIAVIHGNKNYDFDKTVTFAIVAQQTPDNPSLPDLFDKTNDVRLAGSDRFSTSASISQKIIADDEANAIILVNGLNFADALAAGPFAEEVGAPILMVNGVSGAIDKSVVNEINRIDSNHDAKIYIIGGPGAVNTQAEKTLTGMGYNASKIERVYGNSRYETAVKVAEKVDADTAFIAYGLNFPDALGGGSAAAQNDGVVLFTDKGTLDASTKVYLQKEGFKNIVILGGTGAVSANVEKELKALGGDVNVKRISGAGRCETSVEVAKEFFPETETIVVATAFNYADALAGGPLASYLDSPIILVDTVNNKLGADLKEYIKSSGAENFVVLGGDKAVSNTLYTQLQQAMK